MTTTKVTDAVVEPIALDEAKRHLRGLADGDTDPDILQLITDARQACEERLQRSLLPTTWLLTLDAFPGLPGLIQGLSGLSGYERASQMRAPNAIQLNRPPVTAIGFIKYVDTNGVLQTLSPALYLADFTKEPAEITPAYGLAWPATRTQAGAVTVQYTAGYADAAHVPAPIKRWIKLAMTDLYQNRGRSSERPSVPQDFADELLESFTVPVL